MRCGYRTDLGLRLTGDPMPNDERKALSLLAHDVQDLSVVSSVLQDAIVPVFDMVYLEKERTFALAVNRFRWEAGESETAGERVHAGLRFDRVNKVQYRKIDRGERNRFISLLSIAYDAGVVVLHFAGGAAIRLEVDGLLCALKDLDAPWPTIWRPEHSED